MQLVGIGVGLPFRARNTRNVPVLAALTGGSCLSILPSANLPRADDGLRVDPGHCPRYGMHITGWDDMRHLGSA
jgi:hypothetical protein